MIRQRRDQRRKHIAGGSALATRNIIGASGRHGAGLRSLASPVLAMLLTGFFGPVHADVEELPETQKDPVAIPAAPEADSRTGFLAQVQQLSEKVKKSNRIIEEVIVTAQKREENLQDVPISIQAFSADMLDAKGIANPAALQQLTPGMQYNVMVGVTMIYIRGVGADVIFPSADPSVGTYIDGVYYAFGQLAMSLGVIERVEVLKGPQGTLFGRNTTGGAVNIITKQPGPEFETSVQLSQESYDKNTVRVYTNIPLSDSLSISVSGLRYAEDPYYKLVDSSREPFAREISRAFSTKLGWMPNEYFEGVLGYTYTNTSGSQAGLLTSLEPKPLGLALGVRPVPDYQTGVNGGTYLDSRVRIVNGDLKTYTPWFDLRFIGSRQELVGPAGFDFDGTYLPLIVGDVPGQYSKGYTGEVQIISNDSSWGADWLTWVGGLYYLDNTTGFDPALISIGGGLLSYLADPPADGPLSVLRGVTHPLIGFLSNAPGVGGLTRFIDSGAAVVRIGAVLDTESKAAFFQTTAKLNDWMSLTLGGRYQTETRALVKSTVGVQSGNGPFIPILNYAHQSTDTSNFSPKAVLDFKFGDDSLIYLSYSKGFKSGTYNVVNVFPSDYIKPEEVAAYEIGYKDTLLDGSLRFNGAMFWNEIKNLQVLSMSLTSGGFARFENAEQARIRGADFDLLWQPLREVLPGLVLTLGGCYLDGVYTDYPNGSGFDEATGLAFDGTILPKRDFTGNKAVRTPKFTGNVGLSYAFILGPGSLEVAADAYHNSGFEFAAQNTKPMEQSSYNIVNAQISYLFMPWNLRVTVFGKNINGAVYYANKQDFDLTTLGVLAPPDTYGVRLNWDF